MPFRSQPPPRGPPVPGYNREYSGDFNTQGGASYIGDGQNAGRDIINIFAEVVYYSRKRKESSTPEQESEKLAWRDFKHSLRDLGVNPIALNEDQIDLLLKAIAKITGVQGEQEPQETPSSGLHKQERSLFETDGAASLVKKLQISHAGYDLYDQTESTDHSNFSGDDDSSTEESEDIAFDLNRFNGASGGHTGLNRLTPYGLGSSGPKATKITETQVWALDNSLEGIRHLYPSTWNSSARDNFRSTKNPRGGFGSTELVLPSATPFSSGQHEYKLSSFEYPKNLLALPSTSEKIDASFNKAEWTKLQKELKQVGLHLKFVSNKERDHPQSFNNQEQQLFREWCLAPTSRSKELDAWCTEEARPFIRAVRDNDEIELRILLFRGANVNTLMINGMSALHIAVEKKALSIINLLMDNGASIEVDGNLQVTPLHQASAGKDHFEIVEALLCKGGRVDLRGAQGWQAIHVAASWGHTSILQALLAKGADIEARTDFGATPLLIAASGQQTACVQFLLEQGAKVNAADYQGITALFHATFRNCLPTVTALLDNGASMTDRDRAQASVLHHAVGMQHGFEELVDLLLSRGAQIEARNYAGHTPLHIAISRGLTNIIKCLLRHKCDIHSMNMEGDTPLHMAALRGNDHVVELLLHNGALTTAINSARMSPLCLAIRGLHYSTSLLLLNHGAPLEDEFSPPLIWLAIQCHNSYYTPYFPWLDAIDPSEAIVILLLERGASVDKREKTSQMNALCLAVDRDMIEIVRHLLASRRCDPEVPCGPRRASALHFARSVPMVELLLQHSADINAIDSRGLNALHVAAMEDMIDIAELLLREGICLDLVDYTGSSPMLLAIAWASYDIVEMLLDWKDGWDEREIEYAVRFRCKVSEVRSDVNRRIARALLVKMPMLNLPTELTEDISYSASQASGHNENRTRTLNITIENGKVVQRYSSNDSIGTFISAKESRPGSLPNHSFPNEPFTGTKQAGAVKDDLLKELGKRPSIPGFESHDLVQKFLDGLSPNEDASEASKAKHKEATGSERNTPGEPSSSQGPKLNFQNYRYPTVEDESNNSNVNEIEATRDQVDANKPADNKKPENDNNHEDLSNLKDHIISDAIPTASSRPNLQENTPILTGNINNPIVQREPHALDFIREAPTPPEPRQTPNLPGIPTTPAVPGPQHDPRALRFVWSSTHEPEPTTEEKPAQKSREKKPAPTQTTKRKHGSKKRSSKQPTSQDTGSNLWRRMFG